MPLQGDDLADQVFFTTQRGATDPEHEFCMLLTFPRKHHELKIELQERVAVTIPYGDGLARQLSSSDTTTVLRDGMWASVWEVCEEVLALIADGRSLVAGCRQLLVRGTTQCEEDRECAGRY